MSIPRINELHRKQARKRKLKFFKKRYQQAVAAEEKEKIIKKLNTIAPWLSEKEFFK